MSLQQYAVFRCSGKAKPGAGPFRAARGGNSGIGGALAVCV